MKQKSESYIEGGAQTFAWIALYMNKNVNEMESRSFQPREVFCKYFGELQRTITAPLTVAGDLFSKHLIGKETNSRVIVSDGVPYSTKAAWILQNVQVTLEASEQPDADLRTFCDVLDNSGEPALKRTAAKMRSSLGKIL